MCLLQAGKGGRGDGSASVLCACRLGRGAGEMAVLLCLFCPGQLARLVRLPAGTSVVVGRTGGSWCLTVQMGPHSLSAVLSGRPAGGTGGVNGPAQPVCGVLCACWSLSRGDWWREWARTACLWCAVCPMNGRSGRGDWWQCLHSLFWPVDPRCFPYPSSLLLLTQLLLRFPFYLTASVLAVSSYASRTATRATRTTTAPTLPTC